MSSSAGRTARLFRNGRNQAVRIPVEFELPGEEVTIERDGDTLVITPVAARKGLLALLDSWDDIDDPIVEIDDPPIEPEDIF